MVGRWLPGALALVLAGSGCFSLKPVTRVDPEPGTRVAFDLNDAGRAALGNTMGGEILRIEGRLAEDGNDAAAGFLLSVSQVRFLRGGEQIWAGEKVRLKPEYLGLAYERRFSLGRTLAFGAATIGGAAAIIAGTSLFGGGTVDDPGQPCNTDECVPGVRIGRLP